MKNFAKFLGIIALVAVIGFSMTACGGDDNGGGGNISWAGTWQKEGSTSTFTLGANGVGYSFDSGPVDTSNGKVWKAGDDGMGFGPSLRFQELWNDTLTSVEWFYYDRISSTKIHVTIGGNGNTAWVGDWVKQ